MIRHNFSERLKHVLKSILAPKQEWIEEHPIFAAIADGNYVDALKYVAQDPTVLEERNNDGATPLHYTILMGRDQMGKDFITRVPSCALQTYSSPPFLGENVLHLAIMKRDPKLVTWLLQRAPQLLNSETTGGFFTPGGGHYYGGYPLLFAVATNQAMLVDMMVQMHGGEQALWNNILYEDRFGNNALHMTVLHDLPQMFDFVMSLVENMTKSHTHSCYLDFLFRPNKEHLTPLALAAALGHVRMFQHILGRTSHLEWVYGSVKCHLVPLRGLEQPFEMLKGHTRPYLALDIVCSTAYHQFTALLNMQGSNIPPEVRRNRLQLAACNEVKQLLQQKWSAFGHRYFLLRFLLAISINACWTASCIIPNHYALKSGNLNNFPIQNGFIITLEALVMLLLGVELFVGFRPLFGSSIGPYLKERRYLRFDGILCVCFLVLWFVQWGLMFGGQLYPSSAVAIFAALIGAFRVVFLMTSFHFVGPFVIAIKEMLEYDTIRYCIVLTVLVCGFSLAMFVVVYRLNPAIGMKYFDIMRQFFYLAVTNKTDWNGYPISTNWMPDFLVVIFTIFVSLFFTRLLVVLLTVTYNSVLNDAERRFLAERIHIFRFLESSIPDKTMKRYRSQYGVRLPFKPAHKKGGGPMEPCEVCRQVPTDEPEDLYVRVTSVDSNWTKSAAKSSMVVYEEEGRRELLRQEEAEFRRLVLRDGGKTMKAFGGATVIPVWHNPDVTKQENVY